MSNKKLTTSHPSSPITLSEWLKASTNKLAAAGIESARLDCLLLLEHVLEKSREWMLAHEDYKPDADALKKLNDYLAQREMRTPLAYITMSKEFYGRKFFLTENVLIPRPESETIIEMLGELIGSGDSLVVGRALKSTHHSPLTTHDINSIIDVGTGSGCLAVTAKLLFPEVHVIAIDNSAAALKVAKANARQHKAQIQFKQLDIYDALPAMPKTRPYILLVNLPYVPDSLITSREITKEPAAALFSGADGMDHYKKLWQHVARLKNKPEYVITESLRVQHTEMKQRADSAGFELIQGHGLGQTFRRSISNG